MIHTKTMKNIYLPLNFVFNNMKTILQTSVMAFHPPLTTFWPLTNVYSVRFVIKKLLKTIFKTILSPQGRRVRDGAHGDRRFHPSPPPASSTTAWLTSLLPHVLLSCDSPSDWLAGWLVVSQVPARPRTRRKLSSTLPTSQGKVIPLKRRESRKKCPSSHLV